MLRRTARPLVGEGLDGLVGELLLDRLGDAVTPRTTVAVVECSAWQCESHCAELRERWRVDALPWPLERGAEPDADVVVATYFHYNDVRRLWPRLLSRVRFLTIAVDPGLGIWLGDAPSAVVVERDEPTAQAVAGDVLAAFERELKLRTLVTDEPETAVAAAGEGDRVLFSPRVWAELGETTRAQEACGVVRYVFDERELERAARECGWEPVEGALAATGAG